MYNIIVRTSFNGKIFKIIVGFDDKRKTISFIFFCISAVSSQPGLTRGDGLSGLQLKFT